MWITQRFRTIAVFPINWERLDAGVFTSMLLATKRKSRTSATRETNVISERKHCSRKRRHTQVDFRTRRKCADKTQTIARKRWHGARKRKRSNVRSTCGRLYKFCLPWQTCSFRHQLGFSGKRSIARQQLRAKAKSLTFPPLSIARYSFIQLSEQGRQWRERKCPISGLT